VSSTTFAPVSYFIEDTYPFVVPAPGSPWESMNCVGMNILDELSGPGFVGRVQELHIDLCTMYRDLAYPGL